MRVEIPFPAESLDPRSMIYLGNCLVDACEHVPNFATALIGALAAECERRQAVVQGHAASLPARNVGLDLSGAEALLSIRILEAMAGALKHRDGASAEELAWRAKTREFITRLTPASVAAFEPEAN